MTSTGSGPSEKTKILYVDSSVVVSAALRNPQTLSFLEKKFSLYSYCVTSELTHVEGQSGVSFQMSQLKKNPADFEQNLNQILASMVCYAPGSLVIGLARSLVKRYRASLGLRTLDSIHLATASIIRQGLGSDGYVEYVTADRRQHEAFTVEGFLGTLLI
jgi:hypothetical protein